MMKKHDAYNQKNVKLDYYRSKINAIKNNANVLTSLGAKFEQEYVFKVWKTNYAQSLITYWKLELNR